MPLVMFLGAVGVIVLLMVIGMRQRWEPEIPSSFGTGPQPPPLPRIYGLLSIVGISLVVLGGLLGVLLHRPGFLYVGLAAYAATWIVRHVLLFWEMAKSPWTRAAAVARPMWVVLALALCATTRSLWWLIGGTALYVGIWPASRFIERRGERKHSGGLSGSS
jgi:hypothetical protein